MQACCKGGIKIKVPATCQDFVINFAVKSNTTS